jgi:hypothetical protein
MRKFHGLLFHGRGKWSVRVCELLHKRLDEALSLASGLQQPDHPESHEEATACKRIRAVAEHERLDAVRDIVAALTGHEMTLGAELPYPWDDDFGLCTHGKTEKESCKGCGREVLPPRAA